MPVLKNPSQVNHWPVEGPRCFLNNKMNAEASIVDAGTAPANLANGLEKLGMVVEGIDPRMSPLAKLSIAATDAMTGLGRPPCAAELFAEAGG